MVVIGVMEEWEMSADIQVSQTNKINEEKQGSTIRGPQFDYLFTSYIK